MLALPTTSGLDTLRASAIRVHTVPFEDVRAHRVDYAPAMSLFQQTTAQQAITTLRHMPPEFDNIHDFFVTDTAGHLVGVINLRQLIAAPPGARLCDCMTPHVHALPYDATLEQQIHLINESNLLTLPVVDDRGKLVGVMEMRTLIAEIERKSGRGLYHMAGTSEHETTNRSFFLTARDRFGWLLATMASLILMVGLIERFGATIAQTSMLAAIIPLIIGMNTKAATQTMALATRSVSWGCINKTSMRHYLPRELVVSILNGLGIGLLAGLGGWLWHQNMVLGLLTGATLLCSIPLAALAGLLVPLLFHRWHIDSSLPSPMLVTTVTNLGTCLFFLSMAAMLF